MQQEDASENVVTDILSFDFELFIGVQFPNSLDPQKLNVFRFCSLFLLKANHAAVNQTDKHFSFRN